MSKIRSDRNEFLKALIFGVLSSVAVILILMCILCAVLLFSGTIPTQYIDYVTIAFCGIGTLIGSYIAARILRQQGLLIGLMVSFLVFVAVVIAGFVSDQGGISVITPIKAAVMLITGAAGGIKGVNVKEKLHIS